MSNPCPFCHPDLTTSSLWENAGYRIIADQYPLCVGHILLLSKAHYLSHMHAPIEQLKELEAAQDQAAKFLRDNFGKVSFYENGNIHQEVPHAHLHGIPFTFSLPDSWLEQGVLQRAESWQAVWQACERVGYYSYVEADAGRFVLQNDDQYPLLINAARTQLVMQIKAEIDQGTGGIKRGGPEMVVRTIQRWQAWQQKGNGRI